MKHRYLYPTIGKIGFKARPEFVLVSYYEYDQDQELLQIPTDTIVWSKEELRSDLIFGRFHNRRFQEIFDELKSKALPNEIITKFTPVSSETDVKLLLDLQFHDDCLSTLEELEDVVNMPKIYLTSIRDSSDSELFKRLSHEYDMSQKRADIYYEMYCSGFSQVKIASIFGVTKQAVSDAVTIRVKRSLRG